MERTRVKATAPWEGPVTLREEAPIYKTRTTCRACHAESFVPVISLGEQYLVRFVPDIDYHLPKAPLDLVQCLACGLLQLKHTVEPDLLFREFWYRSGINDSMKSALQDLVKSVYHFKQEGVWLDIGANDGYLLSQVEGRFKRIACEPARNFSDELHKVAEEVITDYFTADNACLWKNSRSGACDVITSAAMFYDLDEPDRFVADIAGVLAPDGIWVNQLNDSPTMVRANAFDSICHEHLCYYDIHSLKDLYGRHGLTIVDLTHNDVNGGSMRVFAQRKKDGARQMSLLGLPKVKYEESKRFANRVDKWKKRTNELLDGPLSDHPVWLYGASTKGSVLLQYLNRNESFSGIADRNPSKHGLLMAGTWLGIFPEEDMRQFKPKYVYVLPWAFKKEFTERERPMLDAGTTMIYPLPNIEFVL